MWDCVTSNGMDRICMINKNVNECTKIHKENSLNLEESFEAFCK